MVFLIPTFFGGLFTFFSRSFSAYIRPLYIKLFHYLLACVGFPLAIAALCYGYKKKWFALNHSEESITFLIVITSISAIITMRTPLTKVTRLVKKCFE